MAARDYRHYPTVYAQAIMRFRDHGPHSIGPMTEREARSTVRDFHRYRAALREATDADPTDSFVRELHDAARDCVITATPSFPTRDDGQHWRVSFALNPAVRASREKTVAPS